MPNYKSQHNLLHWEIDWERGLKQYVIKNKVVRPWFDLENLKINQEHWKEKDYRNIWGIFLEIESAIMNRGMLLYKGQQENCV